MSTIGKRVIFKGPADYGNCKPLNIEGKSITASVLPGTILENVAAGLQVNAADATVFGQELLVADKNQMQSKSVDDVWTINENIVAIKLTSGQMANVLVAAGNNITASGVPLSLDGNGVLKIAVTPAVVGATSEQVLCYSDEIINVSGSAALVAIRVA